MHKITTLQVTCTQSELYWLLNLYEGCRVFAADVFGDGSEEKVKPGPNKKVGQAEGRLLRNSTPLASDPHFSPGRFLCL